MSGGANVVDPCDDCQSLVMSLQKETDGMRVELCSERTKRLQAEAERDEAESMFAGCQRRYSEQRDRLILALEALSPKCNRGRYHAILVELGVL